MTSPDRVSDDDADASLAISESFRYMTAEDEVPGEVVHMIIDPRVKEIPEKTFRDCLRLLSVELHAELRIIGPMAFLRCKALKNLVVPASVIEIRERAFQGCTGLIFLHLSDGIKVLGSHSFYECAALKHVRIPTTVTTLSESLFKRCSQLVSVELPLGLQHIEQWAFMECTSLKVVIIPPSVKTIGLAVFSLCSAMNFVELPVGLEIIENCSFYECVSLERIVIPSTVDDIGSGAFRSCTSLVSVEVPEALETMRFGAFPGVSALRNIFIPPSVPGHEYNVAILSDCTDLTTIYPDYDNLIEALKTRFDDLPIHKLCYFQAHHPTTQTISQLEKATSLTVFTTKDKFGMIPLHILALSARPNIDLWKMVLDAHLEGLKVRDKWGSTSYDYLTSNHAPGAVELLRYTIHAEITIRVDSLALERWRTEILDAIEAIPVMGDRSPHITSIHTLLSNYEMKEITSLLELAVWKAKIVDELESMMKNYESEESCLKKQRFDEAASRRNCRINSGIETVMLNVLPFLIGPPKEEEDKEEQDYAAAAS